MTATRFINVYEMGKSNNLLDLDVPVSSLYLLAAPSSEEVREEVIAEVAERAEDGEHITHDQVSRWMHVSGQPDAPRQG
jgi:hypothetical protein